MIRRIQWLSMTAVVGITIMALTGCESFNPQTREEFKQLIVESPRMGLTDTYIVNRRFEDVVRSLETNLQECYNFSVTTSRSQGGLTTMRYTEHYHTTFQKINNSLVEMTVLETRKNRPSGGNFFIALNVERLPANKSKLTWYSYSFGWRESWERTKQWSDGKQVACGA